MLLLSGFADRDFVEAVASDVGVKEGLIEKDWYIVQILRLMAELKLRDGFVPVFGGGTSLSKREMIHRLSEDIDFKMCGPTASTKSAAKRVFSSCRKEILDALAAAGFTCAEGDVQVMRNSSFFQIMMNYPSSFAIPNGFRKQLKIEVNFDSPRLLPTTYSVSSFLALSKKAPPEVTAIACVDIKEIAIDKISAFLWRSKRILDSDSRDGTLIRHLHDLKAIEQHISLTPDFFGAATSVMKADIGRAKCATPDLVSIIEEVHSSLHQDARWKDEYESFIVQFSYADDNKKISFDHARQCWDRLMASIKQNL